MNWKHGEEGPQCFCGNPTAVIVDEKSGDVNLLCLFHTKETGAIFPLPKNNRPDNWPEMSDEEMTVLVEAGFKEQDSNQGMLSEVPVTTNTPDPKKLLN